MAEALAAYARLSKNPDGTLDAVARQNKIMADWADRNGYTITAWYADDNLSAWKKGVKRPGWEALLAGIAVPGQHDGVISYHYDRLARNGRDGERLLDVMEERDLPLYTPQQVLDLGGSADARMMFRVITAVSIKASEDTQRRILDLKQHRRMTGDLQAALGGRARYGWKVEAPPKPTSEEGKPVRGRWVVDPAAAEVLRDVAKRVLANEPLLAAYRMHTADGPLLDGYGLVVDYDRLRATLLMPVTAGLMTEPGTGKILGRVVDDAPLDELTWRAVRAHFWSRLNTERGRPVGRPTKGSGTEASYPLSKQLACKCGNQLTGTPLYGRGPRIPGPRKRYERGEKIPAYACRNPHKRKDGTYMKPCNGVYIRTEELHRLIVDELATWAKTSPRARLMAQQEHDLSGVQRDLDAQLVVLEQNMAHLMARRLRATSHSPAVLAQYDEMEAELDAQMERLNAERATVAAKVANPLPPTLDWEAMNSAEKARIVAEVFVTPIVVNPWTPDTPTARERVDLHVRD
jgi:DNA invertase Pin-like site-specific DNA recombinase